VDSDLISWWVYALAAGILLAVSIAFHFFVKHNAAEDSFARQHGLWGLVIGQDGRTSTSKLNAGLWTLAIVFAFFVLLIDGQVDDFAEHLQEEYLLLLGGPYAAAIGAKAITTAKDTDGTAPKDEVEEGRHVRPTKRVAEIVTDDNGQPDLGDFQYFAFTVVALVYFFVKFVSEPGNGLPEMPGTLVGLTSASALAYLTKKGVYKSEAKVTAVSPRKAGPGEKVKIFGTNLVGSEQQGSDVEPPAPYRGEVLFGGVNADQAQLLKDHPSRNQLEAVVPATARPGDADVTVIPESTGVPAEPVEFEITAGVGSITASPKRIVLGETAELTITGSGFLADGGEPTEANAVELDGVGLATSDWTPTSVKAQLFGSAADLQLQGLGENQQAELVVINYLGQRPAPIRVRVEASEPIEANP
jgi:hypothetical protein